MWSAAVSTLRADLSASANADDAVHMAAYMRDRFPFLGVKTPARRSISRPLVRASTSADSQQLVELVDLLRVQQEREFHYVASDVLRANGTRLTPTTIDRVSRWVRTDAWWDTVDAIASPTVGVMVQHHPELLAVMDRWVEGDEMWLARTAIIHQLRFGAGTDVDRLFGYALARADDDEFFIRKAIGWALRQYARTDPTAVRQFVDEHVERFSGLTIREATKHL